MAYNNALDGLLGTVESTARSSGGTYTLTAGSAYFQFFTGINFDALDKVVLPDVSTIPLGKQFYIVATGLGSLSIQSSGNNEILQISHARIPVVVTCISNSGTGVASWSASPMMSSFIAFEPVVSFATPGDLNVSYNAQFGTIMVVGNLLRVEISLRFTPTYTTASGRLQVTGLPIGFQAADSTGFGGILTRSSVASVPAFPFPASCTMVVPYVTSGSNVVCLRGIGSGTTNVDLGVAEFPTGTERYFRVVIEGPLSPTQ